MPTTRRPRLLWLAVADARGHLMRAHVVRSLLDARGIDVDVVTTSDEGAAFLAALGTPSEVLSREHRVEFDERQNIAWGRSRRRLARYLLDPRRCRRDVRWLAERARGVDLVVNDSFHPALLVAPLSRRFRRELRVVHVFGENLRRSIEESLDGTPLAWVGRAAARLIARSLRRSFGTIEHSFSKGPRPTARRAFRLPPVIASPTRSRDEVREALGVAPGQRLAVAYLNPHFRDPAFAAALEAAVAARGDVLYAVGEGFADRPGWFARDASLADVVAAADVYLSAPGMGALAQARLFGTPFVALVTAQPEQQANLSFLREAPHPWAIVSCPDAASVARELPQALDHLARTKRSPPHELLAAVHARQSAWVETIVHLLGEARLEPRAA